MKNLLLFIFSVLAIFISCGKTSTPSAKDTITLSQYSVSVKPEGETINLHYSANKTITPSVSVDWINIEGEIPAGNFKFSVSKNESGVKRESQIKFTNSDNTVTKFVQVTQEPYVEVQEPEDDELSILAIGNSFSVDAMTYLYDILSEIGYKKIFLGNLYIGGCNLERHAGNIANKSAAYSYYTNDSGKCVEAKSYVANVAIESKSWDYISMQQASGNSGEPNTYEPFLSNIITYLKQTNPKAKLMWHMTWAYQSDSNHQDFPKYGKDQMTMYNAIVNAVKSKVLTNNDIQIVIPCGTAVQNLRTSFIGDHITRDGYHMSLSDGRFLTALMWARQITGKSIDNISFRPSGTYFTPNRAGAIFEAVNSAYSKPYDITASTFTEESPTPTFKEILVQNGYNPDEYVAKEVSLHLYSYYNSTSRSKIYSKENGDTQSNLNQFAATDIFTKSDIPDGALILILPGYQYRPEAWTSLDTKNTTATRPGNIQTPLVKVDDTWWGSWQYRAFNIAKANNPALTESEQNALKSVFAIYVKK